MKPSAHGDQSPGTLTEEDGDKRATADGEGRRWRRSRSFTFTFCEEILRGENKKAGSAAEAPSSTFSHQEMWREGLTVQMKTQQGVLRPFFRGKFGDEI